MKLHGDILDFFCFLLCGFHSVHGAGEGENKTPVWDSLRHAYYIQVAATFLFLFLIQAFEILFVLESIPSVMGQDEYTLER